ncbi:hypothetical protein MMC29_003659 [Sticta canariensis]|nr:hypothetical protein [Sticta canariensis]
MAAWIRQFPDGKVFGSGKDDTCFRRLLISQDSEEIYLTVAECDSAYLSYLIDDEQSAVGEPSFMTMKQYGPWRTKNHHHMEHLGPLVLAFTLQQGLNNSSQENPFTGPIFDKP